MGTVCRKPPIKPLPVDRMLPSALLQIRLGTKQESVLRRQ